MASTITDLLHPQVVLDVVSRVEKNQGSLGRWFGFHANKWDGKGGGLMGPNTTESPTRTGTWRIFDSTRTVMEARAPNTGPATIAPMPIGDVAYTLARFHEKIKFDMERLMALSRVIGPNTAIDTDGKEYVAEQTAFLGERANNAIEMLAAGLVRGKIYLKFVSNERIIPVLTQPGGGFYITIDFMGPAGNFNQLNMTGAGDIIDIRWDQANAPIISKHLPAIVMAFVKLYGAPPTDVWVDPITWGYIITNTEVKNTAGSSSQPFDNWEWDGRSGQDGRPPREQIARLRGYPMLRWHVFVDYLVTDGGTDPQFALGNGTLEQTLPPKTALFTPEVTKDWVDMVHFAELVAEAPGGMPGTRQAGLRIWHEWATQPTVIELLSMLNCLPRLKKPKAMALGTVLT